MPQFTKNLVLLLASALLLAFLLLVIGQTAQVVQLAHTLHPLLGDAALYAFLLLYAIVLGVPLYLFLRMQKPLALPNSEYQEEVDAYVKAIGKRLARNAAISLPKVLTTRGEVEHAFTLLGGKADVIIKETATAVFITTAISQSGRLDALSVLLAQSRMIWKIARLYNQRPSLRELIQLYANVGATTFLAIELDDLDIDEQLEPIITGLAGTSLASAVPGAAVVATFVGNSLVDGSANAFLTLRIGAITKRYCGAMTQTKRKSIRHSATVEASRMLSGIVLSAGVYVSNSIWEAAKRKVGVRKNTTSAKSQAIEPLTTSTSSLMSRIKKPFRRSS